MHREVIFIVQRKPTQLGKAIILKKKKAHPPVLAVGPQRPAFLCLGSSILKRESQQATVERARMQPDQASKGLEAGPC